jgi:hypothetical protein
MDVGLIIMMLERELSRNTDSIIENAGNAKIFEI